MLGPSNSIDSRPHIILIFPPVWVPMVPHLALSALTAYLRERRFRVTPLDANVAFFTDYLLTSEKLIRFASDARRILKQETGISLPDAWQGLLQRELDRWESLIPEISRILEGFRNEHTFFQPDEILRAQDAVQGLLHLVSIAHWPGRISFNHYRRGDIWTEEDLLSLCRDPERNIFLPFWKERVLPQIREASPQAVGISISSVHQFIAGATLAHLLRTEYPQIHVTAGGKHLLRLREKILGHDLYFRDYFHSVVLDEGERPLARLLSALQNGDDLREVPNLIFKGADGLAATHREAPEPLDRLPAPDFDDVPWREYLTARRYAPIRMSEGCYWGKCTFCARYGSESAAHMSPERVVETLSSLRESYGIRDYSVNDDCTPPEYWEELCREILRRRIDLSLLVWAKPVSGFTRKRLDLMAKAGVRQIRWGVESAHPRILRLMRKGTTVPTTTRVLQNSHEAGIWNHACFILGFPTETRREAQKTIDFIRSRSGIIQSFILYSFTLFEHSYIYDHPEEFGIRDIQRTETPFFDLLSFTTETGMAHDETQAVIEKTKESLLETVYGWPFWYFLKLREYLQFYLDRFGLEHTIDIPFQRNGLRRSWEGLGP